MSTEKPPKLLPESVRTLLEFGLKRSKKKGRLGKEQDESAMFNFIKMLVVSNSYFNCSRRANLDIYRLNLNFTRDPNNVWVGFSSKCYDPIGKNFVCLTYDRAYKLVKLLLPSYVGTYFNSKINNLKRTIFEKYVQLLQLVKGKLSLRFHYLVNVQFAQKLLKAFADRTYELWCHINYLKADESLEFPVFDHLFVEAVTNSRDISYILRRCEAKELEFHNIGNDLAGTTRDFTIEDNSLIDLENTSVKKLKLFFEKGDCVKIRKLIEYVHKCCLNLKHVGIEAKFAHNREFSANQIFGQVDTYVRCMNDLKARFENSLVSASIKFEVQITARGNRDNTWVKAICDKPELKDWKFKSESKASLFTRTRDKLEIVFDDAKYKFEMNFEVDYASM